MKRILFTLMMIAMLAMVANTAKAQTSQTPYPGGTYTYTLTGINTSVATATATIGWTGMTKTAVISTTRPEITANEVYTVDGTTATSFIFDVTYDMDETAGSKTLTVTMTNGAGGCTNFINLAITVQNPPTLALQITGATDITCQNLGTPINNENAAQATGTAPAANTLVYTITPSPTPGALTPYTYDFHFELDDWSFGATNLTVTAVSSGTFATGTTGYDISGASGAVTVTVSFTTTPGQAEQNFTATITSPVLTYGSVDYITGNTITTPAAGTNVSTITYTPAIGTFTF